MISWTLYMEVFKLKFKKNETLFYMIMVFFFLFLTYESYQISNVKASPTDVGASFFPISISIVLLILTSILFFSSVKKNNIPKKINNIKYNKETKKISALKIIASFSIILLSYAILLTRIGFIISTILFLCICTFLLYFYKNDKMMNIIIMVKSLILSCIISGLIYFVFSNMFQVMLP